MAEQFSIPTVGDLIAGKYRVESELGRGAYGVVFRADQEELGRHVAVKTLLPQAFLQQDIVQRFHREAQLISRLDHPNIIRLFDYGVDEGLLYMAVEYVQGPTLMDLIDNDAPLEQERVKELCLQILDALVHAHGQGIVHRDLKPENIVLLQTRTTDGREYEVVKILDFGISKLLRGENDANALKSLTQDGTVLGTPHYMSPENIVGDPIDHRADLYAFGIILYELLMGVHPFDAPSPSAVMVRHLRDEVPELVPGVGGTPLGIAIERCLEKQPWDRIGSAEELIEILEANDVSEIAHVPRRPSQELRMGPTPADETTISPNSQRPDAIWFAIGIALVALVVVAVGYTVAVGWKRGAIAEVPPRALAPDVGVGSKIPPEPAEPPSIAAAPDVGGQNPADASSGVAMVFPPSRADAGAAMPPKDDKPEPKITTRPPREPVPKEPDPPEPKTVEVQLSSVPSSASVTVDGVPVGSTPVSRVFEVGQAVQIHFRHIGYKEKVVRLDPTSTSSSVEVTLEKDHLRLVD